MVGGLLDADTGLVALRAIAEPTRLRILLLLSDGELTVKDLTKILGQSQPRISRHLKLMHDASLLARVQEGSWVYFRLTDQAALRNLLRALLGRFDTRSGDYRRDRERADAIRQARFEAAQDFFAKHAGQWDQLRQLHVDEAKVENRICNLLGPEDGDLLIDLGTGTGRVLELLAARFARAIGVDTNPQMLAYARARTQGSDNAHVQIRQGDIANLTIEDQTANAVIMHQVLHYLADPSRAIAEAARILEPSGRLLIVDFKAHSVERLRDDFAHQRLGFSVDQMKSWIEAAGLTLQTYEELPPDETADTTEALTVSIWLANAPARVASVSRNSNNLETAR